MKSRKIWRDCLVCGKKIKVTVFEDGSHKGGYYFGILYLPVGKGTWKHIRYSKYKIGNEKIRVVKWTGKKRKLEYWECPKCFNDAKKLGRMKKESRKAYGKKRRELGEAKKKQKRK